MRARVLLASAVASTRSALRLMLEDRGFDVVGEVSNLADLQPAVGAIEPSVLLMDWALPEADSAASIVAVVLSVSQRVSVVVLSGRPEDRANAISAGAKAFAYLGDTPERLLMALSSALSRGGSTG